MKTSEILIEAKKLIDTPEKWTTETLARNNNDFPVDYYDNNACKFCSLGALKRVASFHHEYIKTGALIREAVGNSSIVNFNDTHTHEEVMAGWDNAIELAQSRGD